LVSVWKDIRTDVTVDKILAKLPDSNTNHFKLISGIKLYTKVVEINTLNLVSFIIYKGLPISPYFSALKLRWLKDNVPAVRKAIRERRCLAGTIDSWLIWV